MSLPLWFLNIHSDGSPPSLAIGDSQRSKRGQPSKTAEEGVRFLNQAYESAKRKLINDWEPTDCYPEQF